MLLLNFTVTTVTMFSLSLLIGSSRKVSSQLGFEMEILETFMSQFWKRSEAAALSSHGESMLDLLFGVCTSSSRCRLCGFPHRTPTSSSTLKTCA